jgi:Tfp pilus assembly protein PilV
MKKRQLRSIQKVWWPINSQQGFSLVEGILSTAVFALLITAFVGTYLYGQEATSLSGNRVRATLLAEEGLEAMRNIRDENFYNLTTGTYGLSISGNKWNLSGSSDTSDVFTRSILISDVDSTRKSVSCTVSWQQNPSRNGSVTLTTQMTNWQDTAPPVASCDEYAVQEGYSVGTCRQSVQKCTQNDEEYLLDGDAYCTGGPVVDTCCALP